MEIDPSKKVWEYARDAGSAILDALSGGGGPDATLGGPRVPKPSPAYPNDQAPGRTSAIESFSRSPAGKPNYSAPGAPTPVPGGGITPPTELKFTQYESSSPVSRYDRDIEATHSLSRMLGMAGLGDKAMAMRDLYHKFSSERMNDLGEQAQRAFLAGDLTKGIDMFNHAVPSGTKINGYRQNADGTVELQMSDGRVEKKTPQQIADSLTAFRDPHIFSQLMQARGKSLADMGKEMAVAGYKGQMSFNQAMATHMFDANAKMALAQFNRAHQISHVTIGMDGTTYVSTPDGVFKQTQGKDLSGKATPMWERAQLPGAQPGGATPAAGGYQMDARKMAESLGLVAPAAQ